GNQGSSGQRRGDGTGDKEKKKYEPPIPTRIGKQKKQEEFIRNQERLKPHKDRHEEERLKVDDIRGSPMAVGTLEEIIDDNHAIVSTSVGSEHYVHAVIGVLGDDVDPIVAVMKLEKVPKET
ncbi:unnamed protein product, partial [Rotaria sp. Silwood1]